MYDCATVARKGASHSNMHSRPADPASHLLYANVGAYPARQRCPKKIPPRVNLDFSLRFDNQDSTDELLVLHRLGGDYWDREQYMTAVTEYRRVESRISAADSGRSL